MQSLALLSALSRSGSNFALSYYTISTSYFLLDVSGVAPFLKSIQAVKDK